MDWDDLSTTPPPPPDTAAPQQSSTAPAQPDTPSWDDLSTTHPSAAAPPSWDDLSETHPSETQQPETSAVGDFAKSAIRSVLPTAAGAWGAVRGAASGAAIGGEIAGVPGGIAGGIIGGVGGFMLAGGAAQEAQDKLADAMGVDSAQERTAEATQHPWAETAGNLAPALPVFGVELGANIASRLLSGAAMGGFNVAQQAVEKGPSNIDPTEAAIATGFGAALGKSSINKGLPDAARAAIEGRRPDGNVNAPADPAAKAEVDKNDVTPVAAGVAADNNPTAGAKTPPAGEQTGDGFVAKGSEQTYPKGADAENPAEGMVEGAPPGPPVTIIDPKTGMDPPLQSTIGSQEQLTPSTEPSSAPAPYQGPDRRVMAAEAQQGADRRAAAQGGPQGNGEMPNQPWDQLLTPEDRAVGPQTPPMRGGQPVDQAGNPIVPTTPDGGDIPPFLKRGPDNKVPGAPEPVAQQAQQPQKPGDNVQSVKQLTQGNPDYDLRAATDKIAADAGAKAPKDLPPKAQAAVDAADERIGRVPLRTRNVVEDWLNKTWFGKAFNPAGIDQSGAEFKVRARSELGQIQGMQDRFDNALTQNMRDAVDKMSPEQQHEIQRAMQDPNPMERLAKFPEIEPFVRSMREQIKADADFKNSKGTLDAEDMERNHFPQMWTYPKAANEFLDNWYSRQGSKSGFMQKKHPTIADGEAAGLKLKFSNPVDAIVARRNGDYKYQMANSLVNDGLAKGLISTEPKSGYIALNAKAVGGTQLYAQEGYATGFNAHYSPGFRTTKSGEQFMDLAQPATAWGNQLLLGLSPFHGFTMMNEGFISQVKLGMQTMARDPVAGAKILAKSPLGGVDLYNVGKKTQRASLGEDMGSNFAETTKLLRNANARFFGHAGDTFEFNPGGTNKSLSPAPAQSIIQAYANGFKQAKNDITTSFNDAQGKPIELSKATLKSVGTAIQAVSHPLFQHIIPAMKAGAAHLELGEWLRQNPNATLGEKTQVTARIWDDVENRFGLMTRDNLFWNNKIKEGMQLGMTSPTWTSGFFRNFGGGVARGIMHPSNISMKAGANYDPNISSALALGITVSLMSGAYQYLKTGKPPGSVYDLMAGQTGGKTATGQPERAILPGFQKDVYGWFHDPLAEAEGKIHVVPKTIIESIANKGWSQTAKGPRYGMISNPADPFWKQIGDRAVHAAQNFMPIGAQQLTKKVHPDTKISTAERALAIREAPKNINPGGNPSETKALAREYKITHPGG